MEAVVVLVIQKKLSPRGQNYPRLVSKLPVDIFKKEIVEMGTGINPPFFPTHLHLSFIIFYLINIFVS